MGPQQDIDLRLGTTQAGDDALDDEGVQAVLNPVGVAAIGEAVRHLVKERRALFDLAQSFGEKSGLNCSLPGDEQKPETPHVGANDK